MEEEISITVLACDFDTKGGSETSASASEMGSNYYKDRRERTLSPLGPDASLEETRAAITRGFKKPTDPNAMDPEKKRKGWRGILRKIAGK